MTEKRHGLLLMLVGPSGVGKGTMAGMLLEKYPEFGFSVSATTRAPRPGEVDGTHYYFLSNEEYDQLLAENAFLEHAEVHGNRYGTLKREVTKRLQTGKSVLLDIDHQGAEQVIASGESCVSVFILPPSMAALEQRLRGRGTETEEAIQRRLGNARGEIATMHNFHYILINDDPERCFAQLCTIVEAEKLRSSRYFPEID